MDAISEKSIIRCVDIKAIHHTRMICFAQNLWYLSTSSTSEPLGKILIKFLLWTILQNRFDTSWNAMSQLESYIISTFFIILFLENILNIRYQKDFYPKIKKIIWILQTLAIANFYSQYTLFNTIQIHLQNVWNFLIILFAQYVWFLEEWNF